MYSVRKAPLILLWPSCGSQCGGVLCPSAKTLTVPEVRLDEVASQGILFVG